MAGEATPTPGPRPGYRPCVGIFLLDHRGRLLAARRTDVAEEAWQLPQGGIDEGEDPVAAGFREMREEIGTDRAVLLRVSRVWRSYDLPPAARAQVRWGDRYRGQTQLWVAFRFTGEDRDIRLDSDGSEVEFSAWRWIDPGELVELAVAFKRAVYASVLEEFADLVAGSPT